MRFIKAIGEWFKSRLSTPRISIQAQLRPDIGFEEIMRSGGKYSISPNDILIVHSPKKLTDKAIANIDRTLKQVLKKSWGYSPVVLLLEEDMSYSVMTPDPFKAPAIDARDLSTT